MFTRKFWKDAIERSISGGAAGLLSMLGVDLASFADINYEAFILAFIIGFSMVLLQCLAFINAGDKDTGSLIKKDED